MSAWWSNTTTPSGLTWVSLSTPCLSSPSSAAPLLVVPQTWAQSWCTAGQTLAHTQPLSRVYTVHTPLSYELLCLSDVDFHLILHEYRMVQLANANSLGNLLVYFTVGELWLGRGVSLK